MGTTPIRLKWNKNIDRPLSPYAVTKFVNELYAEVFARNYGFRSIGLRYFNVFGQRQDPNGAYAAVIPKWFAALLKSETVFINGDGETSRDFCYVENVVQANIRAALNQDPSATDQVYNVAFGQSTTLNVLFRIRSPSVLKKLGVARIEGTSLSIGTSAQVMCVSPWQTLVRRSSCWVMTRGFQSETVLTVLPPGRVVGHSLCVESLAKSPLGRRASLKS